jgi:uncharacterized protein (DUF2235 family)
MIFRDTVSSIGIMRGNKMLPGTIEGMKHVCYFRHALALDERRVKFLPVYSYGGSIQPQRTDTRDESRDANNDDKRTRPLPTENRDASDLEVAELQGKHPHTLEVWFAGTHSDM